MQITLDPNLQNDTALSAAVTQRNPLLESIINGSAQAEWHSGKNWKGQSAVLLRLCDQSGARAGADFLPVEFKNPEQLEIQFRDLKEALLKVRDWRATVARFFVTIRPWCAALPGNPIVTEEPIRVEERVSGEYDITQLVVTRGDRTVRIRPVGAWVLSADGRVDMIGSNYRAYFHYLRRTDAWYRIPESIPFQEVPLTEALFRELAEACFDE